MRKSEMMVGNRGYLVAVAAMSALFVGAVAHAETTDMEKYFTIKSVKIQEVKDNAPRERIDLESPLSMSRLLAPGAGPGAVLDDPAAPGDEGSADSNGSLGEIGQDVHAAHLILDEVINMGKEVWAIVEANRPVVNVQTDTANALPAGARDWTELQGWQAPVEHTYRVTYENLFGMNVVDFEFRVLYTAGGNVAGTGRYLTNLTIVPSDLSVSWGYHFNAHASVPSVTNAGTTRDPIAGAALQLDWSIDTVLKHEQSTANFYVQGDGTFQDLGDGT